VGGRGNVRRTELRAHWIAGTTYHKGRWKLHSTDFKKDRGSSLLYVQRGGGIGVTTDAD